MVSRRRTTFSSASHTTTTGITSYLPYTSYEDTTTTPGCPQTGRQRHATARPRTAVSILGVEAQQIVCAVSESRGVSPTVGLAFVNLETGEAVLSQISDSQTYVRTIHKLMVFSPSDILIVNTAANPTSKLFSIIEENLVDINSKLSLVDRRYFAETTGLDYIQQLALPEDREAIKISISGNYFAVCCFAAAMKYIELVLMRTFSFNSLRMKYEASEGSMMIDVSTTHSMELIQNLQNPKSRDCLFGLLNETVTPMGSRLLRSNILQPLTDHTTLNTRYDALEELTTKEEMFFATRQALKASLDVDRVLTALIVVPTQGPLQYLEQSINNIIMLKQFVVIIKPVFEALSGAKCAMLKEIRQLCAPKNVDPVMELIDSVINEDVTYAKQPIDLRNQRTYAVKSGVNGLLDVARQTYAEATADLGRLVEELGETHDLPLDLRYENARQYYIRLPASELEERDLPPVFINVFRKKNNVECQTLELMKHNRRVINAHEEVMLMSSKAVQELIENVRGSIPTLFKICEGLAMLDMISSFAQLVTSQEYARPRLTDTLAIKAGRHPIREKVQSAKFVPNDVYATQQHRFQIITGCNMSGKSTYIRSVALMSVMAQIGSFVPAQYASLPIVRQIFARVSTDDSIEANISTFAAEMREIAFILRNVNRHSLLGRGTSTRDGLAIALAIAEALVDSHALVWFATHFRDLANIMSERNGVINLHLAVDLSEADTMTMLYKITEGVETEEHYGLALAKVLPLPADMLEHATKVATKLEQQMKKRKKTSLAVVQSRRRKLVLNLKEQLVQAYNGAMEGETLRSWLKELQREFIVRMTAIDAESRQAEFDEASELGGNEGDAPQDDHMAETADEETLEPEAAIGGTEKQ